MGIGFNLKFAAMDNIRKAAILTIGDELMIGQIVDTNSAWISAFLDSQGWLVARKIGVPDQTEEIIAGIELCLATADLLIMTGGLGPTNDDLTVDALCQYFDCKKVWHEETWQRFVEILQRFNREPTDAYKSQCYQPEAAEILPNKHGSAPGTLFRRDNKIVVSLPGVPNEMKYILEYQVIPRIPKGNAGEHRVIRTAGEGETILAEKIKDIEDSLPPEIKLAYLPNFSKVTLRLSARGSQYSEALDRYEAQIKARLGNLVYGTGNISLSQSIGMLLSKRGETLGTAESCTGGYIAHRITSVPGSSEYYLGSVIPYAYELKTALLDISSETLYAHGAVSEHVILEMATHAREKLGASWVVATSGIAGPGGATPHKPVGTIWIACAGPKSTKTKLLKLTRDRDSNIEYASVAALVLLRQMLIEEG